jgi:hypothetical protein
VSTKVESTEPFVALTAPQGTFYLGKVVVPLNVSDSKSGDRFDALFFEIIRDWYTGRSYRNDSYLEVGTNLMDDVTGLSNIMDTKNDCPL